MCDGIECGSNHIAIIKYLVHQAHKQQLEIGFACSWIVKDLFG